MKSRFVGLVACFMLVMGSNLSPQASAATDTDAALTNFISALNTSMPPRTDVAPVANAFAENGVHHGVNQGPPQVGRAQITQFFVGFKDLFADWTHTERSRLVQGNRAAWEGVVQGHDKQTGKPIKLRIVFLLEFDDQGKVQEDRVYVDVHLIGEQVK